MCSRQITRASGAFITDERATSLASPRELPLSAFDLEGRCAFRMRGTLGGAARPVTCEQRSRQVVPDREQGPWQCREWREIQLAERGCETGILHADFDRQCAADGFVEAEQ